MRHSRNVVTVECHGAHKTGRVTVAAVVDISTGVVHTTWIRWTLRERHRNYALCAKRNKNHRVSRCTLRAGNNERDVPQSKSSNRRIRKVTRGSNRIKTTERNMFNNVAPAALFNSQHCLRLNTVASHPRMFLRVSVAPTNPARSRITRVRVIIESNNVVLVVSDKAYERGHGGEMER